MRPPMSILADELNTGDCVIVVDESRVNSQVYVSRVCKQSVHFKWKDGKYYGRFKASKKGFVPVIDRQFFMNVLEKAGEKAILIGQDPKVHTIAAIRRLHVFANHMMSDEFNNQKSEETKNG